MLVINNLKAGHYTPTAWLVTCKWASTRNPPVPIWCHGLMMAHNLWRNMYVVTPH